MAEKKYHIEGDTVIFNNRVTIIYDTDFHTYDEDGEYENDEFRYFKKVVLPDSVTEIDDSAFSDCESLTDITIPDSVTRIGHDAFRGCESLTSIDIPSSVKYIDFGAFSGCNSLTSVTIPSSITSISSHLFSGCSSLTSVTIPNDVESIGWGAFSGCTSLTSITIPNGVTSIDDYVFSGCTNLTSITIPKGVKSIGEYAFSDCENLTSITIPNSVICIWNRAFYNCSGLESITIPDSVTYIACDAFENFKNGAFENCENLTIICNKGSYAEEYAKENNISVEIIGEEKYRIEGDTLIINDGVTTIEGTDFHTYYDEDNGYEGVKDEKFQNVKKVVLPDSVTEIDYDAFYDFQSLKDISLPNSITNIGNYAFTDCINLENVIIPDSVTSIDWYAFMHCTSLKSITIPNSVTSIDNQAFWGCENLTIICDKDSYAEEYAKKYKIPFEYVRQREIKEKALSDIKDYINTLAEAMKHYDGKGDVGTYLEGYVGSSGADLGAFLSETSAAYIRNCFVSAYSGVDFNYTDDKSPIERYEARINSAVDKATSLAEELVNKSEKTSVEEIVDDVMQNEDFKKILKNELKAENDYYFSQEDYDNRLDSYTEEYNETKAEILEDYKDDINSGKMNEQDVNELIGTAMNTDYPAKEDCAVYIRDIKDTILENGAGTLTLDDFGDKHYNVQIESDSEIYTFKVSLPVSKTVGGVKVQGFKELGYIDVDKDEVGKTLKEIAENTAVVVSGKNGSKSLNELFKDNKGKTLD